ncbi:MAG: prepilin-type N-terminal cleavage/methylation domain-containing protein [Proteobacteria bacterium]|nr:prepilin-type N-terminal cleavage/methylation domain-containing protein [Pseudomonadota bacterium]
MRTLSNADRRLSPRRGGFTLIELLVSVAVLMIAFMLILPNLNRLTSQQQCNQAAQRLFGDVRRAAAQALKAESLVVIDSTSTGYTISLVPETSLGNYSYASNTWTVIKRVDFLADFPRVQISNGASTRVILGPKGWPVASGDTSTTLTNGATSAGLTTTASILQTADAGSTNSTNRGQFYRWTCTVGTPTTYTVKLYTNGRIFVDTP